MLKKRENLPVVNGLGKVPVGSIPINNFKHVLRIEETISEKVSNIQLIKTPIPNTFEGLVHPFSRSRCKHLLENSKSSLLMPLTC